MRAMVLRGKTLAIEDVEQPEPGPGQVLAKVRACGICGSDLHAARYLEEMAETSRAARNNAFRTLDPAAPLVMGHEFVAEVVAAGPGAEQWKPGTRVTSVPVLVDAESPTGTRSIGYSPDFPGAYGEYVLMSSPILLEVTDTVPDEVAATTEPCAVGLHAVREAKMQEGEHALVMGAGPIGLMTLLWLKHDGVAHVAVSDYAPTRRALAAQLGADLVLDPAKDDVGASLEAAVGSPAPVVFECVGVQGTLAQAMQLVAPRGRVVVVGVCMQEDTIRPMLGITKHLRLEFVLGYTQEEFAETLAALAAGTVDTRPLITRTVSLDELPAAFEALASPQDCKVILKL